MTDQHEDLGFELPPAAKISRTTMFVILAVVVGGLLAFGLLKHRNARSEVAVAHAEGATKVDVVTPTASKSDRAIALPGSTKALEETKIYPRTIGYVRRWLVDIGDKVKEGELLAEIDTPDIDAQLAQARAQLLSSKAAVKQAEAQRDYSKSNSARYVTLSDQKLVAKSQVEQIQAQAGTDEATVAANQANVVAAEANVRRLVDLQSFAKVVSPFAGTVTTRTIDRGAFVNSDGTTPMFTIEVTDPMRVFVNVPQTVAAGIRPGTDAAITVRELPTRTFPGKVTRAAGALDPDLHVMSTEVQVPNADGALLPGMYVQVSLGLAVPHSVAEIPATALYNDSLGLRVATVDAHDKVHFVPITIERDTGATLWVATGLVGDERVIKIAVPSLTEGDLVEINAMNAAPAAATGSAK